MTPATPRSLTSDHDVSAFGCGVPSLDDWLKRRALPNQVSGASRTYVVCDGKRVVAYYCLAAGSVCRKGALGKPRRNAPEPIPVAVLGRLAVDQSCHGRGFGTALLRDAVLRTLGAADSVSIRALLVHALDQAAADFYRKRGFLDSPIDPLVLMLPIETARAAC